MGTHRTYGMVRAHLSIHSRPRLQALRSLHNVRLHRDSLLSVARLSIGLFADFLFYATQLRRGRCSSRRMGVGGLSVFRILADCSDLGDMVGHVPACCSVLARSETRALFKTQPLAQLRFAVGVCGSSRSGPAFRSAVSCAVGGLEAA